MVVDGRRLGRGGGGGGGRRGRLGGLRPVAGVFTLLLGNSWRGKEEEGGEGRKEGRKEEGRKGGEGGEGGEEGEEGEGGRKGGRGGEERGGRGGVGRGIYIAFVYNIYIITLTQLLANNVRIKVIKYQNV